MKKLRRMGLLCFDTWEKIKQKKLKKSNSERIIYIFWYTLIESGLFNIRINILVLQQAC